MSSRQEQKERRRKEREERERAEANAAKRRKLAQAAGGAVVVVAVIVGIVLAATGGGGGGGDDAAGAEKAPAPARIPPPRVTNLDAAAKAAGCMIRDFPNAGQNHVTDPRRPGDYKMNPPTTGDHNPVPAHDGFFPPGSEPDLGNYVHSLEHGRIQIQYKPGTPVRVQRQLQALFNEPVGDNPEGYHMMMFRNDTGMPFQVAEVAWRHYVGCPKMNDRVFDAFRAFRDKYVDQAPEQIAGRE